jgi:hypothetical protein
MATYETSGGDVFYQWVQSSDVTGTSTDSYTNSIWNTWTSTDSITETSTAYTEGAWGEWTQKIVYVPVPTPWVSEVNTAEQKRARSAQRRINRISQEMKIAEEEERKRLAEVTAQELLEDLIGENELALYNETKRLVVKGRKYDYVIRKQGGVYKVEKGKVIDLCIHLKRQYKYPVTDNVIALKILIEADETEFLRTANSHGELRNERVKQEMLKLVGREVAA